MPCRPVIFLHGPPAHTHQDRAFDNLRISADPVAAVLFTP